MATYHINPKTGKPSRCRAGQRCSLAGQEKHYSTPEAARAAQGSTALPKEPKQWLTDKQAIARLEDLSRNYYRQINLMWKINATGDVREASNLGKELVATRLGYSAIEITLTSSEHLAEEKFKNYRLFTYRVVGQSGKRVTYILDESPLHRDQVLNRFGHPLTPEHAQALLSLEVNK